jgi:hypothetical protein
MATPIILDAVKPNRQFNIKAAVFIDDALGNPIPLIANQVASISYTVYQLLDILPPEITTGRVVTGSGSFVPANVISNTMITGATWDKATTPNYAAGYNWNLPIPGSFIPLLATTYEIQVTTTLNSGLQFDDWYTVSTLNVP